MALRYAFSVFTFQFSDCSKQIFCRSMKLFTELYVELDQTNKTNEKIEALRSYFERASSRDAAWAFYFLSGRKPRQIVPSKLLRQWAIEQAGIPEWLYAESRDTVGDGSETIALLLPNNALIDE